MQRADLAGIVKAALAENQPADHADELEIRQTLVIEHRVELPEAHQRERTDEEHEPHLVAREDDPQRHPPERDGTAESAKKD